MTPQIVVAIENMYNQRVPGPWMYDATGVEISWVTPSLGSWMKGLTARYRQLKNWIERDRPASFWLTGFIRPQGFLTSVKQEVNRQHAADKWALDDVDYSTTILKEEIRSQELGGLGDKP
jgi:dynein heavy chain